MPSWNSCIIGKEKSCISVVLDGSLLKRVLMEFPISGSLIPTVTMNIVRTALCRLRRKILYT